MNFTEEQIAIIESEGDVKVNAVAGSGKTSTIVEYCKRRPDKKILYLVFNKSAQLDAEKKFKKSNVNNVKIQTTHSLAHQAIVNQNNYNVTNSISEDKIKNILKINNIGKMIEYVLSKHIANYLEQYLNSEKSKIVDIDYVGTLKNEEAISFYCNNKDAIQLGVGVLVDKMDKGLIDVTHSFYLKKYQMSNPILDYDIIIVDEFQDSNGLFMDILLKQKSIKVCVGDTHQQIYKWRGSHNALDLVDFPNFPLTKSFRFNQAIADGAMETLNMKKMYDDKYVEVKIEGMANHDDKIKTKAILARTNLSLLKRAIQMIDRKEYTNMYFEGKFESYTFMSGISIYDVYNLYYCNYNYIRNAMVKSMGSFDELIEYSEKSNDMNIKMIIDIVKTYGKKIPDYIKQLKDMQVHDRNEADIILSTVHRAKGLEYCQVELLDFITKEAIYELLLKGKLDPDLINEEINIHYVAKTRCMKRLIQK